MSDGRNFSTLKQCMVALGIVLNIVGAFLALNLRIPIYLDSIGTVLSGALLWCGYRSAWQFHQWHYL